MSLRLTSVLLAAASPVAAQTPPRDLPAPAAEEMEEAEEIVVTAGRPTGSVLGDLRPDVTLSPAAIRSFGVSSVSDLLTELGPQLRSTRGSGRPVVLLNGRRTSGFAEVRNIPAEAILRAEVLPEEAALRYGFPADQRVLNIVLRPRFRAWTGEVEGGLATDGGAGRGQLEATYFRVTRDGRLNVNLNAETTGDILEAQRGIVSTGSTPPFDSLTRFRTLAPAADQLSGNVVWNRGFASGTGLTLSARAQYDEGLSLNGLPFVTTPTGPIYTDALGALTQRTRASELGLGATVDGSRGLWRWSVIGGADRTDARTETTTGLDASAYLAAVAAGQAPPIAGLVTARDPVTARSLTQTANVDALLTGPIAELPAGRANLSVKAQASTSDFTGQSTRPGAPAETRFGRDIVGAQASLDVPLASRRDDVLAVIGDLSVNANLAVRHFSDVGTLSTFGGGFTWSPWRPLQLVGSYTRDDTAPSAQQLAGPVIATPNVPVLDPVTGATVLVTRVSGGTPGLAPSRRRVTKLEANVRPISDKDLTLTAGFTRTRVTDSIAGFPLVTAAIAQAFPERFVRDAFGNLVQVDARAVNFAAQASDVLRWGVNLSLPLGPQPAPRGEQGARGSERPPGGGGPRGGGRGGFGGFGGGGAGRFQAAIYHNWSLTDTITIRPGLPVLDLLDGGALGQSGGSPRHQVEAQAGATFRGFGARVNATWTSGTRIDPGPLNPQGGLRFSPLTQVNLRLFANLGQVPGLADDQPWLRGARVSLGVRNLFNQRLRVTDATGTTPLAFQPGFIDPVGRSVELSFRKLFWTPPARGQRPTDGQPTRGRRPADEAPAGAAPRPAG